MEAIELGVAVEFGEMIRQALEKTSKLDVMVWMGSQEQIRKGELPTLLISQRCELCGGDRPQVLVFQASWNLWICQVCGSQHSDRLKRQA